MSASNHRTKILAAVVLLATFAAGVLVGVVGQRELMRRVMDRHGNRRATQFVLERLERKLDLTADQRSRIEQILVRRHQRMGELRRGLDPQIRKEIEQANVEIEKILNPEQRKIFAEMKMRLMPRHRSPRGGPR